MRFLCILLALTSVLLVSGDETETSSTTYIIVDGRTAAVPNRPKQHGDSSSTAAAPLDAHPSAAAPSPTTAPLASKPGGNADTKPAADSSTADPAVVSSPATPAGDQGTNLTTTGAVDGTTTPTEAVRADTPAADNTTALVPAATGDEVIAVDRAANYGPAVGCVPPTTPEPEPQGVSIQQLPQDGRPNFIVILTDDQGWDDIGLHHPEEPGSRPNFVNTPNLDKFLLTSKQFDNFYVAPMCSQSRAALLTGRDYPHTGTMLVNGGYDYINRGERTSANILADGGYQTAHFGKWHNGRTLGYEPWFMGFQESWFPDLYIQLDNLMRHNGKYVQTYGLMEQDLMDKMLGYLDKQAANNTKPFYLYYAPNAIHQGFLRPGQGPKWQRPAPEPYLAKYEYLLGKNISQSTIEVWAFLEYMDDVLGRLFDYIDNSPLKHNTYVMILSDNGSELFQGEMSNREARMPSGMQGYKRAVEEGGIRNYLAIKGPGVQAGVIDSTLLDITDILPTMVDLAGLQAPAADEQAFTGVSFKNLLQTGAARPATARSTQSLATPQQQDRFLFSLSPICWDPDSVPELDENREVIKPQKLTDYDLGGISNDLYSNFYNDTVNGTGVGYQRCIGVRYQDYKWLGRTNKVYRLVNNSHIELSCNEVKGPEGKAVAALMSGAARNWWNSLVASPHSFQKPTFYLGFEGWNVTNFLPDGAHDRTFGNVKLLPNGASGFVEPGDRMCFGVEIDAGGDYEVIPIYASNVVATFKLSVGKYADIQAGTAPSLRCQLPTSAKMAGQHMGYIHLESTNGHKVDACLVLEENSTPGSPVFTNLGNLRFIKTDPVNDDDPSVDEIVYAASDSSTASSNTTDAVSSSTTAAVQPQASEQQLSKDNTAGGQDISGLSGAKGAGNTSSTSTSASTPAGISDYYIPGKYSPIWITKAMRQIIPGWSSRNNPGDSTTVEDNPAMATGIVTSSTAVVAAAGGRKGGPRSTKSSAPAGSKLGAAAAVGRVTALGAKGNSVHPLHVGGKHGITRHQLHKRRAARAATAAQGLDVGGEYKWLVAGPVLEPSSRMRVGAPQPEPEEVVGAMPDISAAGNNSSSNSNDNTGPEQLPSAASAGQSAVQQADHSRRGAQGSSEGDQGSSKTVQTDLTGIKRKYLKATPAMQEVEQQALRAAAVAKAKERLMVDGKRDAATDAAWQRLRLKNNWPDGQRQLESMYSPYHAEMVDACQACKPRI